MSTAARAVLILWLIVGPAGCAAGQGGDAASVATSGAGPQPIPVDFSLNMVRIGEDGELGRFVLWCDGSLYWDPKTDRNQMPGLRRVLSRVELEAFWGLVQELGMNDPANGTEAMNPKMIEAERGVTAYVAVFTGGGRRWAFRSRETDVESLDPRMNRLLEKMTELAWVDADADTPAFPSRYDFGPDPYARYR